MGSGGNGTVQVSNLTQLAMADIVKTSICLAGRLVAWRARQATPGLRLVAESSCFSCGGPCREPFLAYTTAAWSLPCQLALLLLSKEGFHALFSGKPSRVQLRQRAGALCPRRGLALRRRADRRRRPAGLQRRARPFWQVTSLLLDARADAVGVPLAGAESRQVVPAGRGQCRAGSGLDGRALRPGHRVVLPGPRQGAGGGAQAFGGAGGPAVGSGRPGGVAVEGPARQAGRRQHQPIGGHRGESTGLPATTPAKEGLGFPSDSLGGTAVAGDGRGPGIGVRALCGQGDGGDGVIPRTVGVSAAWRRRAGRPFLLFVLPDGAAAACGRRRGGALAPAAQVRFSARAAVGGRRPYRRLAQTGASGVDE